MRTITGCEGDLVNMTCDSENKISIQSVRYGSTKGNKSQCDNGGVDQNNEIQCNIQSALGFIQSFCQGKDKCSFPVSSSILGSHSSECSSDQQHQHHHHRKHLQVRYQCRPSSFRSRTICRDDTDSISCPLENQGLIILSATFESVKDNYFFCPNINSQHNASSVSKKSSMGQCVKTSVRSKVEQLCHSKVNCDLKASASFLQAPECEHLNVFLKVIYACVEQKNIIPLALSELNIEGQETTTRSKTADTAFTTSIKSFGTTKYTDANKDELNSQGLEKVNSEEEEILEVGKMRNDKKMIYSSAELKIISDLNQDKKFNEHGDILNTGRTDSELNIQQKSDESDDILLSNFEDPKILTVLITSVSGVVLILGLALIFSLVCRKRAETNTTSCSPPPGTGHGQLKSPMINLDSVSLESDDVEFKPQRDKEQPQKSSTMSTLSTFQNTELSLLLPSSASSSSSTGSCSGSSQFLQDIKTLDEKYSLVSSTPSVNLDKRMGKFKTFSESTLLESISETDSECHQRLSEEFNSNNLRFKDRLSSIGGSTTFSDRDAEHSFEHYNHHHDSVCMCNNSQCQNNQNSTFII